jgi:hypothetical protein
VVSFLVSPICVTYCAHSFHTTGSSQKHFANSSNYEAHRYAIYSLYVTRLPQQNPPNAIYVTYTTVMESNTLPAARHCAHHSDCLVTILNLPPGYLSQHSPAHGIDDRRIGVRCQTEADISLLRSIQTDSNDTFLERCGTAESQQNLRIDYTQQFQIANTALQQYSRRRDLV